MTNLEKFEHLKTLEKAISKHSTPELLVLHKSASDSIDTDALINDLILKRLADKHGKTAPDVNMQRTAGYIDPDALKTVGVEKAKAPKSTDDTIETEKHTDPSVDLTIQLLTDYYKDWQHPGSKYKNREMKGY